MTPEEIAAAMEQRRQFLANCSREELLQIVDDLTNMYIQTNQQLMQANKVIEALRTQLATIEQQTLIRGLAPLMKLKYKN